MARLTSSAESAIRSYARRAVAVEKKKDPAISDRNLADAMINAIIDIGFEFTAKSGSAAETSVEAAGTLSKMAAPMPSRKARLNILQALSKAELFPATVNSVPSGGIFIGIDTAVTELSALITEKDE